MSQVESVSESYWAGLEYESSRSRVKSECRRVGIKFEFIKIGTHVQVRGLESPSLNNIILGIPYTIVHYKKLIQIHLNKQFYNIFYRKPQPLKRSKRYEICL